MNAPALICSTQGGLEFSAAVICIKAKLNVGAPSPSAVPDLVCPRWDFPGGQNYHVQDLFTELLWIESIRFHTWHARISRSL